MNKTLEPEYYENFSCLAAGCQYHCCQHWGISLTRAEYNKMRGITSPAGRCQHPESSMKRDKKKGNDIYYAAMILDEDGCCPFLDTDSLCSLQKKYGPGVLSFTCKTFPREQVKLGEYYQLTCSTGCEQVVQLLLEAKDGLRFVERQRPPEQLIARQLALELPPGREFMADYFERTRMLCIAILQDTRYTLAERMILLGVALRDLDEATAQGAAAVENWLVRRAALLGGDTQETKKTLAGFPSNSSLGVFNAVSLEARFFSNSRYPSVKAFMKCVEEGLGLKTTLYSENNDSHELNIEYNEELYAAAREAGARLEAETGRLLENVLVNLFFESIYPFKNALSWDDYLQFCSIYNYFTVITAAYVSRHPEREGYIHALTMCSRSLYHCKDRLVMNLKRFHDTGSDTLAHMAMLVKD